MNDQANQSAEASDTPQVDEMMVLKQRAKMMGITFSNNIGLEALRQKINAKMNSEDEQDENDPSVKLEFNPLVPELGAKTAEKIPLRKYLHAREMKLVRLRITNLDPKKKDLPGEIITVANRFLGTVRKFIPFGEATDEGYHVPYCIYKVLKRRQFLSIRTSQRGHQTFVESRYVKEFSLDVLPPLSVEELQRLATSQAAAGTFAINT